MNKNTKENWRLSTYTNSANVTITRILRDGVEVGHIHRALHPTIPYEVFWGGGAKRCNTLQDGLEIVKGDPR